MADLNYPAVYPFNDGDVISADGLYSCIWNDVTADLATSLGVVNHLNEDNFDPTFRVACEQTQRGSHVFAVGASGTANLDWKGLTYGMFSSYEETSEDFELTDDLPFYPIPGGCVSVYAPWPCIVLVMWEVFWYNANYTANDTDERTRLFLTIDGEYVEAQTRSVNRAGELTAPATGRLFEFEPYAYQKSRFWGGHCFVELDQGWHNIGLNVVQTAQVILGRVHGVSIDVVPFKYGNAG